MAARHLPRSGTRNEGSQVRGAGQTAGQREVNYGRRGMGRPRSSASAPRAADLKPGAIRSAAAPPFRLSLRETPKVFHIIAGFANPSISQLDNRALLKISLPLCRSLSYEERKSRSFSCATPDVPRFYGLRRALLPRLQIPKHKLKRKGSY